MHKSASTQNRRSNLSSAIADLRDRVGGRMLDRAGSCCASRRRIETGACAAWRRPRPNPWPAHRRQRRRSNAIRSTGKIVLGYRPDAAPMSYRDASGKPTGYSVALCSKVADALKRELSLPSLDVRVGCGERGLRRLRAARGRSRLRRRRGHAGAPARGVVLDSGVPWRHLRARPHGCVERVAARARGTAATVPAAVARHAAADARASHIFGTRRFDDARRAEGAHRGACA